MMRNRYASRDSEETEPLYGSSLDAAEEVKPWDLFTNTPREPSVGSSVESKIYDFSVKSLKIFTIVATFLLVLGSAVVSKATTLFMTSQIRPNLTRAYCNQRLDITKQFVVTIPDVERVVWIWLLIFAYWIPEVGTLIRSLRKCYFKRWEMPTFRQFLSLAITEGCPAIGSAILIFAVFPELDVIKAGMLTNAVCFVPGIVGFFSRKPASVEGSLKMVLDIVSIVAQATSFVIWPLLEEKPILYMIPVAVILISVGWWENFLSEDSPIPFLSKAAKSKKVFESGTYFLYIFVSVLKSALFLATVVLIYWWRENQVSFLFDNFSEAFGAHKIRVDEILPIFPTDNSPDYSGAMKTGDGTILTTSYMTPISVWLINFISTYVCYACGKFACKVMLQDISYAFPINLVVPVMLSGLIAMCGTYVDDECAFRDTIPEYLFFLPPPLYFLSDFVSQQHSWIWLIWLLSQAWITIHIWTPNCEKLASTEKLYVRPMYDAFLIDQSVALNRRRNESAPLADQNEEQIEELDPLDNNNENITRIYACGTMWHETEDEVMEFLKSIFRLDQDQCANRIVRKYLQLNLPSYYEFETHIFFDDAYVRTHAEDKDPHVNEYVELLVESMDKAATKVHGTVVKVRPPTIYPTPYGGRLVWTLPGKTKMIVHLKDKAKIRAKKRWSQVMYMYYLLGYKLMDNEEIPLYRKEKVSENTFLLALDGDIDFQPDALHLLVDYMKKNKGLGAACGRIHPVGSGGMAWYQMFEYAIGHWLQKATEHVIGCVLCSPGCFSLFRGKALMDDAVMNKYTTTATQAAHYVQYDQGEDRWLCTLLLQRGYRVEYSAASDAYTHCPEGFNEFYNQRRRWMPSTMANIMDLLSDYKHTVKINENISMLYIGYQIILLIGTVLGPGTIFLMLVGAFVAAFGLDQWSSLLWNLVPILIFVVVCATCSSDIQLFFAGLISAVYGLIMMAVFVGVMLQINQDGLLAPTSLFFFCMAGEMIFAAMLHPKEFNCLKYGVVYYVTVPSMYMLLVIYSVFNMNNVSWGTREVTVVAKSANPDDKAAEKKKPDTVQSKVLSFLGASPDDNSGAFEFALNKLFKCTFCTYKSDDKEDKQLKAIQDSLTAVTRKLDYIERMQLGLLTDSRLSGPFLDRNSMTMEPRATVNNPRTTVMEGSKANRVSSQFNRQSSLIGDFSIPEEDETASSPSDDVVENSWFYDGGLVDGDVKFLNRREEIFWDELIAKYLEPIEDDKEKVQKDLKDLRDKMVTTFFMLNSLFVLVVFLLTLEKDTLHVNWPIDAKVNFTYTLAENEFALYRTYLQLEPIGFVFLIFFALLMVVQGGAMLVHRFGTFSQILTNTRLGLFKKSVTNMSMDEIMMADPLKMAKDLQNLRGVNDEQEDKPLDSVQNRKTVSNLAQAAAGARKSAQIFELDKAFLARLKDIGENLHNKQADISDDRRKSVAWINQRRQTLKGRPSIQKLEDHNMEMEESNL